jgi:Flp pilus assembly protein TadD
VLDYGTEVVKRAAEVAPQALLLALLAGATIMALRRWPVIGFVGACFFIILAPSSSVMPLAGQTMAEHRVYLPLASLVALAVIGLHAVVGWRGLALWVLAAVGFGVLTVRRNLDYRSDLVIWTDTLAKRPDNVRAHHNLGNKLATKGRIEEAIQHYERALQIKPTYYPVLLSLGSVMLRTGRVDDAIRQFEQTLQFNPACAEAFSNLGVIYCERGRMADGVSYLEHALLLKPGLADAHYNLGNARLMLGDPSAAIGCYEQALRIKPDYAEAHNNLGTALLRSGRGAEAREHYAAALRLKPDYAEARDNLAGLPTPSQETGPKP